MSNATFTFGKYNGMTPAQIAERDRGYIEWAAGTDIGARNPQLGKAIDAVLADAPESTFTLNAIDVPTFEITIRGGGSAHGVSGESVNAQGFTRSLPVDEDNRSASGKSGSYTQKTPTENGVYLITTVIGSIANARRSTQYVALIDGQWSEIVENSKNAALACLADIE